LQGGLTRRKCLDRVLDRRVKRAGCFSPPPCDGLPLRCQDIHTALAALRMTSSTTSGFDNMGTCEEATSVVVAFMRVETKRCGSGGTAWSWVVREYQLGLAFHDAVPSTFWLKRSATGAACVAYTSFCSASGRSPAKCLTPLCLSQMRPSGTSRWPNTGDVGNLPSRL